jgi:protein phosphatase inhibitor 2
LPNNELPPAGTGERPSMPARELSEKEIVQMNTEINAGNGHRRNSSNPRSSVSRRQSSQSGSLENGQVDEEHDEHGMRLKWDEANLYLNEGQMGGKMKIDEPKTPFVRSSDYPDDEEETTNLNAQDIAVDELEMSKSSKNKNGHTEDVPDLDIGEPEMETQAGPLSQRRESDSDRRVTVGSGDGMDIDGLHHGEHEEDMSTDELAKHRKFEQMRKKHYEMKNIKNLLGHPEALDDMDDEK